MEYKATISEYKEEVDEGFIKNRLDLMESSYNLPAC